ncbi:hypothetical protein E9549_08520 [Blastococcus sp. MG754426]|nr:hypothetical protein [Blastococcus sp. MG754426]MCF6512568.1 hypothetical protein [Blastococcus sp. MG754427]
MITFGQRQTRFRCSAGRLTSRRSTGVLSPHPRSRSWLIGTVLGFLVLNALVVALGAASTARYEEERRKQARQDGTGW